MSELVALSFDADASPAIQFRAPAGTDRAGAGGSDGAIYGWGVGWYPASERGASVLKDPTSSGDSAVSDALRDWRRFRSTVFVCHLRGHQRARNQEDAQPFVRSYGGRQWIFAHDGDLTPDWAQRFPLPDDPAFDPLGRTDSEQAFCWLLARIHAQRARALADIAPGELLGWMRDLNAGGRLNALLTDGEHIVVYQDAKGHGQLHWDRRLPPHATDELASESVRISLTAPEDPNRTALIFSSRPLSDETWRPLVPGGLLVARRGSIIWNSDPEVHFGYAGPTDVLPGAVARGQLEAGQQLASAQPLPVVTSAAPAIGDMTARTLRIAHQTRYEYSQTVDRSTHRLLLRPVEDRGQQLLDFALDIEPPVAFSEYEDVFGNAALSLEITKPFSELQITSHATVRVFPGRSLEHRTVHGRHGIPLIWMPWQRQMLSAYLMPPELPETQLNELYEFAMSFVERNDYDLVGTLLDMNETLYRDFEYVPGHTTNETTPFQVFESRRGVCQDFANLMICLARLLHVPARYRMGYIFTGAQYANKLQSEASHAWLELYIPRVGWHGFDPTNGIQVGGNHVRVACGRNYRDATPTSGTIYRGGGTETLTVSVRVESVPDPIA